MKFGDFIAGIICAVILTWSIREVVRQEFLFLEYPTIMIFLECLILVNINRRYYQIRSLLQQNDKVIGEKKEPKFTE